MIGSARHFAVIFNLSLILLIKTRRFEHEVRRSLNLSTSEAQPKFTIRN